MLKLSRIKVILTASHLTALSSRFGHSFMFIVPSAELYSEALNLSYVDHLLQGQ